MSLTPFTRPAKILPGVYISGIIAAKAVLRPSIARNLPSFRTILSLGHNEVTLPLRNPSYLVHKQIPFSVLPTQNLLISLDKACSFIRYSIRRDGGGSILVHCLDGLNLSPSIAIAYVMQAKCLDYDAALAVVRAAKPGAQPAPHFEEQLRIWQKVDHSIFDPQGREKVPYALWLLSMKDTFKKQESELQELMDDAEGGGAEDDKKVDRWLENEVES